MPIAVQAAPERCCYVQPQPNYNDTNVKSLLNLFDETPVVKNPELHVPVVSVVQKPEPIPLFVPPALMSLFNQTVKKEEPVQKSDPVLMSLFSQTMQPVAVVQEEPVPVVVEEPVPVVVEEPVPVVVEEPVPVVVEEPVPVVVEDPVPVVPHRSSGQRLSSIFSISSPKDKSAPVIKSDGVNKIKIHRIKNDEPVIEPNIPIRIIKIDVPKQKTMVTTPHPQEKPQMIKIVKTANDKQEKPQQVKILNVKTPKTENKESVKAIEPLISRQQSQQPTPEVQTKLNQLDQQNKILTQKLTEMTAAYVHAYQQNKNLAIALSMRK